MISATASIQSSDSTLDNETVFRQLTLTHQRHALAAGIELTPYKDPSLPLFRARTEEQQKQAISALGTFVKICNDVQAAGQKINDSPALLWRFLQEYGYRPPSDLFSHIRSDSVVEVHTLQGIQIFRNFNFYRFCSYTIEELYCQPWDLMFDRHDAPHEQIVEFVMKCARGEIVNTVRTGIPDHIVAELYSLKQNVVRINVELGAPLFEGKTSKPVATVVIEAITPAPAGDRYAPRALASRTSVREMMQT